MAQRAKPIDLTRSYLPLDPNSLTETMHDTQGEDRPEERNPVVPYEGYNFMPTAYGYRSYFGLNSTMDISDLPNPDKCRDIFVFQKQDLSNILIALCDDGIWTKNGQTTGDWIQEIELDEPDEGETLEWSKCIIENILYIYRQANDVVYVYESPEYVFTEETPTTLNMSGQLGIFKAGSRLGFWDSDNSVAWSAFEDKFDLAPSIGTGSNTTKFNDVIGKIINIVQHGGGFIIYATKSIVGVAKDINNNFLWKADAISEIAGISYRNQVTFSSPDSIHFVWSSIGFQRINNFQAEVVTPELYDFLKEQQIPIYLKFLEGRYIFVQLSDSKYVDGIVTFYTQTIDPQTFVLSEVQDAVLLIPDYTIVPEWLSDEDLARVWQAFDRFPGHVVQLLDHGGCADASDYCLGVDYGVYEDHILIPSAPGDDLSVLSAGLATARTRVGMTINGQDIYLVAAEAPLNSNTEDGLAIDFTDQTTLENENNFYRKVSALYDKHNTWVENTVNELETRLSGFREGQSTINSAYTVAPKTLPIGGNGTFNNQGIALVSGITISASGPLNPSILNNASVRYYQDFWLSYGRSGELFYVNAYALKSTQYEFTLDKLDSSYRYPITIQLANETGIAMATLVAAINAIIVSINASLPQFNATGACVVTTSSELSSVIQAMNTKGSYFAASTAPHMQVSLAATPADYSYLTLAGVISASVATGLTLTTTITGASAIDYGSSVLVEYSDSGHSGDAGNPHNYSWTVQLTSTGLQSSDQLTYTKTVRNNDQPCDYNSGDLRYISWSYPTSYIRYLADGTTEPSPNTPPALAMSNTGFGLLPTAAQTQDVCSLYSDGSRGHPTFLNMGMNSSPADWDSPYTFTIEDTSFEYTFHADAVDFTVPGSTFLLQSGAPVPIDILWKGAYVYDTHIKRWGKLKAEYRQLLDFSPVNSSALNTIPFTQFGVQGSLLNDDGEIKLFDKLPDDAYIKYGKIGLFRQGNTAFEEVRGDFRQPCTGQLEVETSLDGRSVEVALIETRDYTDTKQVSEGFDNVGRWHNITFRGQFDLSYLEFRAWVHSRR